MKKRNKTEATESKQPVENKRQEDENSDFMEPNSKKPVSKKTKSKGSESKALERKGTESKATKRKGTENEEPESRKIVKKKTEKSSKGLRGWISRKIGFSMGLR
ncbi:MAG: hypothetical protein PHC69_08485, partial [Ruminiclostridium sp.]|nr:hypothetical protein [Ruminiclostridium sp.]